MPKKRPRPRHSGSSKGIGPRRREQSRLDREVARQRKLHPITEKKGAPLTESGFVQEVVAEETKRPGKTPEQKAAQRADSAARRIEKLNARTVVDGWTIQPMSLAKHGTETGYSNWYCWCPLCQRGHELWEIDRKRGLPAEKRRGSKHRPMMIPFEELEKYPNLLEHYDRCPPDKIPVELKNWMDRRKLLGNGHHKETEIVVDAEPMITPEIPDEPPAPPMKPVPPPVENNDVTIIAHDQKTVTYSDGATITREETQFVIIQSNGIEMRLPVVATV